MTIRIKHECSYDGSEWITEGGDKILMKDNFFAREVHSGREVMILYSKVTHQDMSASWEVEVARVFDRHTLEELPFKLKGLSRASWMRDEVEIWYKIEEQQ